MSPRFVHLLEPGRIGSVITRNRIVKTGASMCYWHSDHTHMSEKAKAYYGAVARGGVGLLIVESPVVDWPYGTRWRERYRIDDDRYIAGLAELAEVIHAAGCPTFVQLWHDGPWQNPLFPGPPVYEGPPIGASPVKLDAPGDFHRDVPRPLSVGEIETLIDKFASAAFRIKQAGFDGVDINAASSHLLHNFLSPFWNRREDEYGGSVENRARLLTSIIREIKSRCGHDFAVSVLINGIELGRAIGVDDARCLTHAQALQIARLVEQAGADAIQVRNHWLGYHVGGFFPDYLFYPEPPIPISQFPREYNARLRGPGANIYLAEALKRTVSIPVIVVGKMDPRLGEQYLREGKADFIAMTRRIQADPELPNKLISAAEDDIAPCTACGTCLDQSISMERRCRINAALGTVEYELKPAARRKRVVVVGGGPAGLEAARVAAERGHEVVLLEKSRRLGGLTNLAALIKGLEPEELPAIVKYYRRRLKKLGVKVRLGVKADASRIAALHPDAVVVAVGGKLTSPPVATAGFSEGSMGTEARSSADMARVPKILTAPELHRRVKPFLRLFGPKLLGWLTHIWLPIGKKVVVIGGGFQGLEVAEFLVKRGRKVTVLEESPEIGEGVVDFRLGMLLDWFGRRGVEIVPSVSDIAVVPGGVRFVREDGKPVRVEADTVITTAPLMPNDELAREIEGRVAEVYCIGDSSQAGLIVDAVAAGWRVARQL
ncbi:MAG: FAD-dependent oxidoreductase [Thermoleophilia bacterium]|nr:FAD-dependent oxidoreductase [Thermoleophilia bacterium]